MTAFKPFIQSLQPLRAPEEIWADLRALEWESEGLLGEIMGGGETLSFGILSL